VSSSRQPESRHPSGNRGRTRSEPVDHLPPRLEFDEDDCCEHQVPLWEYCKDCEGDGEALFDADELGLDPELDQDQLLEGGGEGA